MRALLVLNLLFFLLSAQALATVGEDLAAEAELKCAAILAASEAELAGVRHDFEHNTNYAIEVPTTEVKDQCELRSCWAFSGLSNLKQRILTHTGKVIDLSEYYEIVQSFRMKVVAATETPGEQFAPGGSPGNVDWLVGDVGAVPDSVWRPIKDFKNPMVIKRLYYFINARLAQFHVAYAKAKTQKLKDKLQTKAQFDLLALIDAYSGPLPTSFTYDGVKYESPEHFAETMIPPDPRPTVRYEPPESPLPDDLKDVVNEAAAHPVKGPKPKHFETKKLKLKEIGEKIREALARGESVRIGYESVHEFIDEATGIMSIAAFVVPKGFRPPARKYRKASNIQGRGHAVEIVGIDLGANGEIIKFKIKNSHGTAIGDKGFMHMYWDYFAAFVEDVYIREPGPTQ